MERVILLPLFFTTASAAVRVTVGANSALRASPLGLRALRDLGLVSQQLRELQELVQPAAEQGCKAPTQASEIASLRAVLDGGIVSLTGSLGELTASIEAASRRHARASVRLSRPRWAARAPPVATRRSRSPP
jgi:phage-related tail protein